MMRPRWVVAAVLVLVVATLAVVTWRTAVGLARTPIIAQLVSFRALVAIAAIVGAILFVVIAVRARPARVLCGGISVALVACAAANAAILAVRGDDRGGAPATDSIAVLTWNTLGDAPGAEAIADLVVQTGADVVSLPETTRATAESVTQVLADAGVNMQTFTVAYDHESTARSTSLLVSSRLGEYRADESAVTTAVLPTVVASPVDGTGPTLLAVHTLAPIPPMMLAWQDDLAWVAAECDDDVIVAGDFNATIDHFSSVAPGTGDLGECTDGALQVGSAASGTWPTAFPPVLASPIDHVLATPEWRFVSVEVIATHDGYGTDHRPVLAQLTRAD